MRSQLSKTDLYESVKTLVETENQKILLPQHKLYTLFSIAFQYLLFKSTKEPGAYILRFENSQLADKLTRNSKDSSTKNFIQSMLLPRKLKFQKSMFFLDFFHAGSWNQTSTIPEEKIKGILVVKRSEGINFEPPVVDPQEGEEATEVQEVPEILKTQYIDSISHLNAKTIFIHSEGSYENYTEVNFPFIKKDKPKSVAGVTLSDEIDWDNIDA
jgi:hypothetical protein